MLGQSFSWKQSSSEQPDAAAAAAVAAPAAVAASLHKSRHTMTKYLQIARRASEKPPLSIQIYFRSFLRWFVRYDSFGFRGSKVSSIIILFASDARALSCAFRLATCYAAAQTIVYSLSPSLSLTRSASPFPTPFCCSQDAPPGSKLLRRLPRGGRRRRSSRSRSATVRV